mgnify:CR=1 FL=1
MCTMCCHLGKPKGEPKPELSLAPVAEALTKLLGQPVKFAADANVVGENAKAVVEQMKGPLKLSLNYSYANSAKYLMVLTIWLV